MKSKCPVCNNACVTAASFGEFYHIHKCLKCSHLHVSPIPSDAELSEFYAGFNWRKPTGSITESEIDGLKVRFSAISETIRNVGKLEGNKLLDWGCGVGLDALGLSQNGWQVTVTDIDQEALAYARSILPSHTEVVSDAEQLIRSGRKFDVIWCAHVIEHCPQPKDLISSLKSLLSHNGVLVASTPNSRSLEFLFRYELISRYCLNSNYTTRGVKILEFIRHRWIYIDPPRHLSIYSVNSLRNDLSNSGLKVERCDSELSPWAEFNVGRPYNYSIVRIRSVLKILRNLPPHLIAILIRALDKKRLHGDSLVSIARKID